MSHGGGGHGGGGHEHGGHHEHGGYGGHYGSNHGFGYGGHEHAGHAHFDNPVMVGFLDNSDFGGHGEHGPEGPTGLSGAGSSEHQLTAEEHFQKFHRAVLFFCNPQKLQRLQSQELRAINLAGTIEDRIQENWKQGLWTRQDCQNLAREIDWRIDVADDRRKQLEEDATWEAQKAVGNVPVTPAPPSTNRRRILDVEVKIVDGRLNISMK